MPKNTRTTVAALCCECGNQRTVSQRAHLRDYVRCDRNTNARLTCTLKCRVCTRDTTHALLLPELPTIPLPVGTTSNFEWEMPESTGLPQPNRYFDGTTRIVVRKLTHPPFGERRRPEPVKVRVLGCLWADGTTETAVSVHELSWEDSLSSPEARALAAALTAAADEADRIARNNQAGYQ